MPKFMWVKCDCGSQMCERYVLQIGKLYTGIVESRPVLQEDGSEKVNWGATILVAGDSVTGHSGGGNSRDYYMDFVESNIYTWLRELFQFINIDSMPEREIWSASYERDNDGVLRRQKLS